MLLRQCSSFGNIVLLFFLLFIPNPCESSLFGHPNVLPNVEVCLESESRGFDWHYISRYGPSYKYLHLGQGLLTDEYSQGVISTLIPLFNTLQITSKIPLSNNENNTTPVYQSEERIVNLSIPPKLGTGLEEYYQKVSELIDEMQDLKYSKDTADQNVTFLFLPTPSANLHSFYNYHYIFDGVSGFQRFFNFIFKNTPAPSPRITPLWPWIKVKLSDLVPLTLSTNVVAVQEVFIVSHIPHYHQFIKSPKNSTKTLHDILITNLLDGLSDSNTVPRSISYISSIKYGAQLYFTMNLTCFTPPRIPNYDQQLKKGARELFLEQITPEKFNSLFPNTLFNISFPWEPLSFVSYSINIQDPHTHHSDDGGNIEQLVYQDLTSLLNANASEVIKIINLWRKYILSLDFSELYPIAIQARNFMIDDFHQLHQQVNNISSYENMRDNDVDDLVDVPYSDVDSESESSWGNYLENATMTQEEFISWKFDQYIQGYRSVIKIYTTRCAEGRLPPFPVLELMWQLTYLVYIVCLLLISGFFYILIGTVLAQLMLSGQMSLPRFLVIREYPVQMFIVYPWFGSQENHEHQD